MKKNWKSIIAFAMALTMCASLAGCGDTNEASSKTNGGSNSAAVGNVADDSAADSSTAEGDSSAAVADSSDVDSDSTSDEYAFYNDLAAEWDKMPKTHSFQTTSGTSAFEAEDGKIYVLSAPSEAYGYTNHVMIYDPSTKETKTIQTKGNLNFYVNGYIYSFSGTVCKYDTEGNLIAESVKFDKHNNDIAIADSGEIFYLDSPLDAGKHKVKMLSADLQTITDIPYPQGEGAHGISADVGLGGFIGTYGDKILAYNRDLNDNTKFIPAIWAWDINTQEWEKLCEGFTANEKYYEAGFKLVGKYLLGKNYVLDLEAGEKIVDVSYTLSNQYGFSNTYFGGLYSIIGESNIGTFYKGKFSSNGGAGENDGVVIKFYGENVCCVNETYYVVMDEYGIFLRTYDGGEADEETIILFQ